MSADRWCRDRTRSFRPYDSTTRNHRPKGDRLVPPVGRSWTSLDEFESFVDAGGITERNDDLPAPYRDAVFRFIELHANSELMGGLTELDVDPTCPGPPRRWRCWPRRRTRSATPTLWTWWPPIWGEVAGRGLEDLFAGRSRFHNVFHYPAVTWPNQVAIAYLVDAAALISQQAVLKVCSYGPYPAGCSGASWPRKAFTCVTVKRCCCRFAEGTPEQHAMFQEALDRWWLAGAAALRARLGSGRRPDPVADQVGAQRGAT